MSENDSNQFCHFYIDKKNKLVEPAPHLRGMIARTYLYMRDTYQLALAGDELRLYQAWHQQYPVTEWERERNNKIKEIQGKKNPYIN
jgi:deoxyribonuclease-1